jgi:phosphoserine phosphatase
MMKPSNTIFAFDLDGTVTKAEILPLIAQELGLCEEMTLLTQLTLEGKLRFPESFRLRVQILRSVPISRVQRIVAEVPLDPAIADFIASRPERCVIVTGNLDCWVAPLRAKLGCGFHTSVARSVGDSLEGIVSIQDKGSAVRALRAHADHVVAVGESVNDIPMFEEADVGVAFGGVHQPVRPLVEISDSVSFDGRSLCQLLNTLS